jgi:hypothetical protein
MWRLVHYFVREIIMNMVDAFALFTAADHIRLHKVARIVVAGTIYGDTQDLLDEALSAAFRAARSQGDRSWSKDELMTHLIRTIQSTGAAAR